MSDETSTSRFGSRKFLFASGLCVVASGLLVGHFIDADTWLKVCTTACLGYLAANVAQKATAAKAGTLLP